MIARHAKGDDLFSILAMFRRHHEAEGFDWPFDAAKLSLTAQRAMYDPDQCLLVCDGGVLMASCSESPVAPFKIASETIIRAEKPGAREALLAAYEEWALERGCTSVRISSIRKHNVFARLWGRCGYSLCETVFSKPL